MTDIPWAMEVQQRARIVSLSAEIGESLSFLINAQANDKTNWKTSRL